MRAVSQKLAAFVYSKTAHVEADAFVRPAERGEAWSAASVATTFSSPQSAVIARSARNPGRMRPGLHVSCWHAAILSMESPAIARSARNPGRMRPGLHVSCWFRDNNFHLSRRSIRPLPSPAILSPVGDQSSPHRILQHVLHSRIQTFRRAHDMVEGFFLPNRPGSSQFLINSAR